MAALEKQLKAEIEKKVLPALTAVVREKVRRYLYKIDSDDKKRFLDAITIERIECINHTILEGPQFDERNDTTGDHQFPGHLTRHGRRERRVGGRVHGSVNHPPANVGGDAGFSHLTQDNYREDPCPVPAHTRRTRRRNTAHFTHRLHLSVQTDCCIGVRDRIPFLVGSSSGGGAGALLGAAGGTAGGAAAGAAIGSVVPIAGTLVGGVIGAIAGGVGGAVVGGGAGAGIGTGAGAVYREIRQQEVKSVDVFKKLSDSPCADDKKTCQCTIIVNIVCPAEYHNLGSS